ncbi:RNA-binding domain-containing protein [Choiromyces venosus 120613-1]|uniref:Nucleolar protein 12 n=1 Tax=Choiromyces venosus 120613-1 TaxID=1336337 RepID=A0A3N4K1S6_9PEZI|nr:RNA-binding domain-containing protein [Choiromyces venosus 120613-1]
MGKKSKSEKDSVTAPSGGKIDPSLASLFYSSFGAVQVPQKASIKDIQSNKATEDEPEGDDENLSEAEGSDLEGTSDDGAANNSQSEDDEDMEDVQATAVPEEKKRKRKRRDDNQEIEDVYLQKLQDAQEVEDKRRMSKKTKTKADDEESQESEEEDSDAEKEEEPPIKHESLTNPQDVELDKSSRTIFLGNVPSIAISSKSSYKTLKTHFKTAGKIISIRFRSVAFSEQIPRKAAFVTHKLHEKQQTVNAYIVYSTPAEAREALKLNGQVVLDRHIRVDSVAHPSPQDHKRCVFIGNLDFEAQEENLWRHFGTCGKVESVRIVRDAKTNVGKGFAYVQFEDPMSVDEALLLDSKKMANDRKLRVTRAKSTKRNQTRKPDPPTSSSSKRFLKGRSVYVPKMDPKVKDTVSRAHKLLGRAGAAQLKSQSEVFEGLRASANTDSGIKKGGSGKKKAGKPRSRARSAAWKQKGK